MKNHRFPWLRNRTTDNRKCEKARNIKEKCTIEMFSTVSRPPAARLSSPSVNRTLGILQSSLRKQGALFFGTEASLRRFLDKRRGDRYNAHKS